MRYDVLLSFTGEDIRRTFLSHLLHSLDRKGITSFTYEASNRSVNLSVRQSLVALPVISKHYTSLNLWVDYTFLNLWVQEIARVIDDQVKVVPVFLRVDPLDVLRVVRLAQADLGNVGEPLVRSLETVKKWLHRHVTRQSGFNSSHCEDDSQLVEKITRFISDTVTQDTIPPHRSFPRLDWLMIPWEDSHSLEHTYGSYSSEIHMTSSRPHTSSILDSSYSSETVFEPSSHVTSWRDKFIRMIPFLNRSNRSETETTIIEEPSSYPSETVFTSSWWDKFIRMIPFVNRSNRSETETIIAEASSSGPRRDMNHRIEEVLSMLQPEPGDDSIEEVRTVGLCGIEGVGKTTLAKCVYEEISSQFQHHFFISNFSQRGSGGLLELLASDTLNTTTEEMVGRKVLLVADSVADIKQLKLLAKEVSLFGPGSRVIVITQDRSLLYQCGVKHIYQVACPGFDEAIKLFSQFAFRRTNPLTDFERLSGRAVEVAGRIPLVLKVLGSYLHGRGPDEWVSTLSRLEETHNNYTTEEVLKYIGADDSARTTRTLVELEENEENRFPLYVSPLSDLGYDSMLNCI